MYTEKLCTKLAPSESMSEIKYYAQWHEFTISAITRKTKKKKKK